MVKRTENCVSIISARVTAASTNFQLLRTGRLMTRNSIWWFKVSVFYVCSQMIEFYNLMSHMAAVDLFRLVTINMD